MHNNNFDWTVYLHLLGGGYEISSPQISNLIGQFELTLVQYITLLTIISGVLATISLLLNFLLVW